jgi:hypothetical protein
MGGDNSKKNLILLTGREHFFCHLLLHKIYPNNVDLLSAIFLMIKHCKLNSLNNSKYYEKIKQNLAKELSEKRQGKNNPMWKKNAYANKSKEEMKLIGKKISNAIKGKKKGRRIFNVITNEIKVIKDNEPLPIGWQLYKNSGQSFYTEESKKKMSESAKKRGTPIAAFRDKHGENNPMWGRKHSKKIKKSIGQLNRKNMLGRKWFNNGQKSILVYECPVGFNPGRLKR